MKQKKPQQTLSMKSWIWRIEYTFYHYSFHLCLKCVQRLVQSLEMSVKVKEVQYEITVNLHKKFFMHLWRFTGWEGVAYMKDFSLEIQMQCRVMNVKWELYRVFFKNHIIW